MKDITNINIDTNLSKEERIKTFIKEIENPYLFHVGEIKVRTSFSENAITMQERMSEYFERILS